MEKVEKVRSKEGRFAMSRTRILNKAVTMALILLLTLSMLGVLASIRVQASPAEDLTPDYAKAGATLDILYFEVVGWTPGGTTLTSVTVDYNGTSVDDVLYMAVYVSLPPYSDWTFFGWGGYIVDPDAEVITGSYTIPAGVAARVKLTIVLRSTATEGNTVDAKITDYDVTFNPPGSGSDEPPIDPVGSTTIDNTPPVVTLTAPTDNEYIIEDTYTVSATASDTLAGVANVTFYYSLDGGETWEPIGTNTTSPYSYLWDLSDLSDQTGIQVKALAVDNAGNTAEDVNTVITLDRTEPTIIIISPLPNAYVNTTTPTINVTLANGVSGIDEESIYIEVDGEEVTPNWNWIEEPYNGTLTYSPELDEGPHTVYVYVADMAGNEAEETWTFTVDITPPTISDLTPEPESCVNTATPTISATLADTLSGINPSTIVMKLGVSLLEYTYDPDTGTVSYTPTYPLTEGTYVVHVYVEDYAGNSAEEEWGFTVALAVSVTLTAPPDDAYITTNTYTVTATASSVAGVASVSFYYKLAGGDWVLIGTDTTSPYSYLWDLSDLSDQTGIQVKALAVDNAGNTAEDVNTGITLDRARPTAPSELTAEATPGAIVLNWTAAEDATSGVAYYNIYRGTEPGEYGEEPIGTASETSYIDTTGTTGITYYYVVTAVDYAGWESDYSNEASATYIPGEVSTVDVTAEPLVVQANGIDESTITATVKDQYGNPIPGATVTFTTTLGTLGNGTATGTTVTATTNATGVATVTLTSTTRGTATVTATADSISDTVEVEFYGAAGIEDVMDMLAEIKSAIDELELKFHEDGTFWAFVNNWFTTIQNAISTSTNDILEAISGIDAKLGTFTGTDTVASLLYDIKEEAIPSIGEALSRVQADLSEIKAAIAPPMVIEGTKECPNKGSVELFNVNKTMTNGAPFKVSFTIDATELDSGDRVYVEVYVKATAESGPVLAKQVLVYGRTGADPREVYMDSLVNAEQVTVQLKWYYGTTSDDPIHFQAVISSP